VPADDPGCRARFLLGVYLLGGLSGTEEAAVEAHLADCPRCQAECGELESVPGLLDLVLPADFPMAGGPSESP
jgi:anti-sigma factor RsiW